MGASCTSAASKGKQMSNAITNKSASLAKSLAFLGWELRAVDVDLDAESCRIEIVSGDRLVTFDARNGSASITREIVDHEQVFVGRRGDRMPVNRIRMRLLGRTRCQGLRSGLRALSDYVSDNSSMLISRDAARDLFRPLLVSESPAQPDTPHTAQDAPQPPQ